MSTLLMLAAIPVLVAVGLLAGTSPDVRAGMVREVRREREIRRWRREQAPHPRNHDRLPLTSLQTSQWHRPEFDLRTVPPTQRKGT